jgi:hypothetical protein
MNGVADEGLEGQGLTEDESDAYREAVLAAAEALGHSLDYVVLKVGVRARGPALITLDVEPALVPELLRTTADFAEQALLEEAEADDGTDAGAS